MRVFTTSVSAALFVCVAVCATVTSAAAGPLRDGEYDCSTFGANGIMAMGHMDIRGDTYRYRPFDKVISNFARYSVNGDSITWSGPMGGLKTPPSVITESHPTDYGFLIKYRTLPSGGYVESMTCRHM